MRVLMMFEGNIKTNKVNEVDVEDSNFVSLNVVKDELRDLLLLTYDDFPDQLVNITIGNVKNVMKLLSVFSALIVPGQYIIDNSSNICANKVTGATLQLVFFYRLNTESSSTSLIEAVDVLVEKFQSKKAYRTLNNSVGNAYINKINFSPYNSREIKVFLAEIEIMVEY
jgi:hypothetical protein